MIKEGDKVVCIKLDQRVGIDTGYRVNVGDTGIAGTLVVGGGREVQWIRWGEDGKFPCTLGYSPSDEGVYFEKVEEKEMAKGDHKDNDEYIRLAMLKRFNMLLVDDQTSHDVYEGAQVFHGLVDAKNRLFDGTLHEFRCGDLLIYVNNEVAEALRIEGARIRISRLWDEFEDLDISNSGSVALKIREIFSEICEIAEDFQIGAEDAQ